MCNTKKLIEKVREEPILYDLSHSEYKNKTKKDEIWDEMAVSMEMESGKEKFSVFLEFFFILSLKIFILMSKYYYFKTKRIFRVFVC